MTQETCPDFGSCARRYRTDQFGPIKMIRDASLAPMTRENRTGR